VKTLTVAGIAGAVGWYGAHYMFELEAGTLVRSNGILNRVVLKASIRNGWKAVGILRNKIQDNIPE
jgi:hypothetical protein